MADIERYLQAGTRENTRRSYQSAIRHFEEEWGGFLPATSDDVAHYLAHYAQNLSINTLRLRIAALAQWHQSQGFPDPTKAPLIRQIIKGIRAVHGSTVKQATPLAIEHLRQIIEYLNKFEQQATEKNDGAAIFRSKRNRALLLLGFWRGFRSDELCRINVEHIQVNPGRGMRLYLPWSKGDRHNLGHHYSVPALATLCPVDAYLDWTVAAGLSEGAVFRGIDRWGNISTKPLNPGSLIKVFRGCFEQAGLVGEHYSTHSLRRGFATWAMANGWDLKALMEYIGWKDVQSAIRYVDPVMPFESDQLLQFSRN